MLHSTNDSNTNLWKNTEIYLVQVNKIRLYQKSRNGNHIPSRPYCLLTSLVTKWMIIEKKKKINEKSIIQKYKLWLKWKHKGNYFILKFSLTLFIQIGICIIRWLLGKFSWKPMNYIWSFPPGSWSREGSAGDWLQRSLFLVNWSCEVNTLSW